MKISGIDPSYPERSLPDLQPICEAEESEQSAIMDAFIKESEQSVTYRDSSGYGVRRLAGLVRLGIQNPDIRHLVDLQHDSIRHIGSRLSVRPVFITSNACGQAVCEVMSAYTVLFPDRVDIDYMRDEVVAVLHSGNNLAILEASRLIERIWTARPQLIGPTSDMLVVDTPPGVPLNAWGILNASVVHGWRPDAAQLEKLGARLTLPMRSAGCFTDLRYGLDFMARLARTDPAAVDTAQVQGRRLTDVLLERIHHHPQDPLFDDLQADVHFTARQVDGFLCDLCVQSHPQLRRMASRIASGDDLFHVFDTLRGGLPI